MRADTVIARRKKKIQGFSLVELLIVVAVLGILASMVIPQFAMADAAAEQATFARSIGRFNEAAQIYMNATGELVEDASSGQLPTGWEPYVDERGWVSPTPVGGVWDFEQNSFGFTSCFGVHFLDPNENPGDTYMEDIDRLIDDGNLNTGSFRKIDTDRYYSILIR